MNFNAAARIIALASALAALAGPAAAAEPLRPGLFRRHPRVISYDPGKDRFVHQESLVTTIPDERPGGETAYYGNRLQTFRYLGRPGTGGIYDALADNHRRLDPNLYRYRFRW
jgi:hypothetical protein